MASIESYQSRVLAAHPELVDQFVDQDLADAHARLGQAQAEIDKANQEIAELIEFKYQLHPELRPQAVSVEPAVEAVEAEVA